METTFSIGYNDNVNVTEVLKNYSRNVKIETDPESERRHSLIWSTTLYLAILLLSVTVNLKVLCILAGFPKRRRRKATSILIAHMSTVAIFYTFFVLLLVAEHANVINDFRGRGICETLTFIQNTLFSVFTFNIIAIIYERFRSFSSHTGSLLVHRLLVLIWITSLVLSTPSIFTIVYTSTENKGKYWTRRDACKPIPLLGIQGASLVYELVRFSLLHVFVVGYMTYALIRLRSKLRHLHVLKPSPNERMRRKVQSIRFIYIHFITFILVWLPLGTLLFVYRTLKRSLATSPSPSPEDETATDSQIILRRILAALFLLYIILNPFIYLLLIIDKPGWRDFLCCYFESRTRKITRNRSRHGDEEDNKGNETSKREPRLRQENIEMSVFSGQQSATKTGVKVKTVLKTSHSFEDSRISTVALTPCSPGKEVV